MIEDLLNKIQDTQLNKCQINFSMIMSQIVHGTLQCLIGTLNV